MNLLFGVHDLGIFDHFAALAQQCRDQGASVTFSDASADVAAEALDIERVAQRNLGGAHEIEESSIALRRQFDAVLVQTPYNEQRSRQWRELGPRDGLTYPGYGLGLVQWTSGHFDLPFYRRCRRILLASPGSIQPHLDRGVPRSSLQLTGSPLWHEIYHAVRDGAPETGIPVLLWMPHWTEDWFGSPGFSTWSETVFDVLSIARELEYVQVRLRPHPLLLKVIAEPDSSRTPPHRALRELLELENVTLSINSLLDDLRGSSVALTDGVTVIAFAAGAGLPVGVCRRTGAPSFNEAGEAIVDRCDVLRDSAERRAWLRNQLTKPVPRNVESAAATTVLEWFPLDQDHSPGEIFLNWLADGNATPTG